MRSAARWKRRHPRTFAPERLNPPINATCAPFGDQSGPTAICKHVKRRNLLAGKRLLVVRALAVDAAV